MEFYKQLKTFFQNIKTANQEYETLKTEVKNTNYIVLLLTSSFAIIAFFLLYVFSLLTPETRFTPVSYLYISYSLVSFLFLMITWLILQRRQNFLIFVIYAFMLFLFSYAYYVDIFKNSNQTSVIFCSILFMIPILFIDRAFRMNLFTILITATFIISSYLVKPIEIALKDTVNGIIFLSMELIFSKYFIYIRLRDLLILHLPSSEDYDEMMGIFNKNALIREITKHLLTSKSSGVLLLIDFKNFKQINDFYGMDFGDSILKQVADEIKNIFRSNDVIGRYAGDKIIVFMPQIRNIDVAKVRSRMTLVALEEKIKIPKDAFTLTANIGITSCNEYGETTKSLLKKAEVALSKAKIKGFNQIVVE